jgi:hypothetical protein
MNVDEDLAVYGKYRFLEKLVISNSNNNLVAFFSSISISIYFI